MLLHRRLQQDKVERLHDVQDGCRPNRGTADCLWSMRRPIELARALACPLHTAFPHSGQVDRHATRCPATTMFAGSIPGCPGEVATPILHMDGGDHAGHEDLGPPAPTRPTEGLAHVAHDQDMWKEVQPVAINEPVVGVVLFQ